MKDKRAVDAMNGSVVSINADASVQQLVALMAETEVSGLPVVDAGGALVGIVTQADLVVGEKGLHFPPFLHILDGIVFLDGMKRFEEELRRIAAATVADLMTSDVIAVPETMPLDEVVSIIDARELERVPVTDSEGRLVGMITRADIIRAIS